MAQPEQTEFIQQFQTSMQQLRDANTAADTNRQQNLAFNATLTDRLRSINTQLGQLRELIQRFREQATQIRDEIQDNQAVVQDNTEELRDLQDRLQQLTQENEQLRATIAQREGEIAELEQQIQTLNGTSADQVQRIAELQNQLDGCNQQRENLERQNTALQEQLNANTTDDRVRAQTEENERLRRELAAEIQKCTDEKTQLNEQIAAAGKQTAELQQRINELERQNLDDVSETSSASGTGTSYATAAEDYNERAGELQNEIRELTERNQELTGQMQQAMQSMNQAAATLNNMAISAPNAETRQIITDLLNQIMTSLAGATEDINQPPPAPPTVPPAAPTTSPSVMPMSSSTSAAPSATLSQPAPSSGLTTAINAMSSVPQTIPSNPGDVRVPGPLPHNEPTIIPQYVADENNASAAVAPPTNNTIIPKFGKTLGQIKSMLAAKNSQILKNNPNYENNNYKRALDRLNIADTMEAIDASLNGLTLTSNGQGFKGGSVSGRTRRKTGGFKYNKLTKRKNLRMDTSLSATTSSINSRKSSKRKTSHPAPSGWW